MEPEGSLPHSQITATSPYSEPARCSNTLTSHFLNIHLNIILPSKPGPPKWSLSLRFPHQKPCTRLSSPPYALHAPPISFFSILITRTILGEQYRSWTWGRNTGTNLTQQYAEIYLLQSLYMFRASQHPSSGALETVTSSSVPLPIPQVAVTVSSAPDDGCCDARNM